MSSNLVRVAEAANAKQPSATNDSSRTSSTRSDTNKAYAEFKAKTIAEAGDKGSSFNISAQDRAYLESTSKGRQLLSAAEKANPKVVASQSAAPASMAPDEVNTNYAIFKAEQIVSGKGTSAFTLTAQDKELLHKAAYSSKNPEKEATKALLTQILTIERTPMVEASRKDFAATDFLEAKESDTAKSLAATVGEEKAAISLLLAKEYYPAYVEKQTGLHRDVSYTEADLARSISTQIDTLMAKPNATLNIAGVRYGGSETQKKVEASRQQTQPSAAPNVMTLELDGALERKAEQKLAYEAFQNVSKDLQKTGGGTITQEALAEERNNLVSTKYVDGVPVMDDKAAAEALGVNYSSFKANSIIEGAKSGKGSAFSLTDKDVERLDVAMGMSGMNTPAREVQALPGQTAALAKVEKMVANPGETKLTPDEVKSLEFLGFEGLRNESGSIVAKPHEINSYMDFLSGKGAPDDSIAQPARGVGLQAKSPFAIELTGPHGEIIKGSFANIEYMRPDLTNPFLVEKKVTAPQYGPQRTSNHMEIPKPSGNPLLDMYEGGKAPVGNLAKDLGLGSVGIGLGFEALAEIALGKKESRAAARAGELGSQVQHKAELEMQLYGIGTKAVSDLISTGKTGVGMKDVEDIQKNVLANPGYAIGNILGSAALWVGPQAVTKGIKIAQAGTKGATSFMRPLRAAEAEKLATTAAKSLGFDNIGIQALGKGETPLSQGPLGYFLRPVTPMGGRIAYPKIDVLGEAATLGVRKVPLKVPAKVESILIRSGTEEAIDEIGHILTKTKEVQIASSPLSEVEKLAAKGWKFDPPKIGIGPANLVKRQLKPGEAAAVKVEDIFGIGQTGKEAQNLLGQRIGLPTAAKDMLEAAGTLIRPTKVPKVPHSASSLDFSPVLPTRMLGGPLIKMASQDPIASLVTFTFKDLSVAAKAGGKRAAQIARAEDALDEISRMTSIKPRVARSDAASVMKIVEKTKQQEMSLLPKMAKAEPSTVKTTNLARSLLGASAQAARSLGFGGVTGAERVSKDAGIDFALDFSRTPPGFDMPSMTHKKLNFESASYSSTSLPQIATGGVKMDIERLFGLRNTPKGMDDVGLGLDAFLQNPLKESSMVAPGLTTMPMLGLDTMQQQITKQTLKFDLVTPSLPTMRRRTPHVPPLFNPEVKTRKKKKGRKHKGLKRSKREWKVSDIILLTYGKEAADVFKGFDDWDNI